MCTLIVRHVYMLSGRWGNLKYIAATVLACRLDLGPRGHCSAGRLKAINTASKQLAQPSRAHMRLYVKKKGFRSRAPFLSTYKRTCALRAWAEESRVHKIVRTRRCACTRAQTHIHACTCTHVCHRWAPVVEVVAAAGAPAAGAGVLRFRSAGPLI